MIMSDLQYKVCLQKHSQGECIHNIDFSHFITSYKILYDHNDYYYSDYYILYFIEVYYMFQKMSNTNVYTYV